MIKTFLAETSSPSTLVIVEPKTFFRTSNDVPLVHIYQLFHHSHLVQSKNCPSLAIGNLKRGGKGMYFVIIQKIRGPEGKIPFCCSLRVGIPLLHTELHMWEKKPLLTEYETTASGSAVVSICQISTPRHFSAGLKFFILRKYFFFLLFFFFLHYTYISPQHIPDSLQSLYKIQRDQWIKYQLRNVQPESRGLKWRQFVSSLSASSH